ncbi:hypothetical protein SISNIDRAFT_476315 [Sistotremastrum niveocremeum HHB9708]|uniref:NADH dehydrogenase [ubiquinone] iron-sulfur protein 5 n=2 Tax=Sistotremastraceae TaxID=3402574 RepID=A0A164N1L1_9AGAM|nr:hypothetical protein SISNIDRAFT_476315 [Sistotremastrum niveocremeum HHB9708]KZT37470.1 hypothetical protein SISSUDRAFT_1071181 [Sistotremastrum suecicum HHB10207 ss-3]
MASGFGYAGGRSRCFTFWQEFSKCYAGADTPSECRLQAEDYLECLHHKNETARAKAIQAEFAKRVKHEAHEGRKEAQILKDGAVVGVGLIESTSK